MSFWYLATPYAGYPGSRWTAYVLACKNAGLLLGAGIPVFCPIAHSHPIATTAQLDADHAGWLALDEKFMAVAHGLIVCKLPGWDKSKGVAHEMAYMKSKPLIMMEPGHLPPELVQT